MKHFGYVPLTAGFEVIGPCKEGQIMHLSSNLGIERHRDCFPHLLYAFQRTKQSTVVLVPLPCLSPPVGGSQLVKTALGHNSEP